MKQLEVIRKIKDILPNQRGIQVALLIGSWGRNEANPNSDIDIQLVVDQDFVIDAFTSSLSNLFDGQIMNILQLEVKHKIVVYLLDDIKVEFLLYERIEDTRRYYIGSEITEFENTILYVRDEIYQDVITFLSEFVQDYKVTVNKKNVKLEAYKLIDKFIYEFESCSALHRRGDAYRFYFLYNIAFHTAIQLRHLLSDEVRLNFLPRNVASKVLSDSEKRDFYALRGTLYLPEGNMQKRRLLNFFYSVIHRVLDEKEINGVKSFLESIYERDFFWNFRDISKYNPKIKSGNVYRSATLTIFQKDAKLYELIDRLGIKNN